MNAELLSDRAFPRGVADIVSEQVAHALRTDSLDDLNHITPYAACLLPLLGALGSRASERDIIEALPHFANHLDLTDLRNMLVTLGFESDEYPAKFNEIRSELTPCLFVASRDRVFVVKERRGEDYVYFDGKAGEEKLGRLDLSGQVFAFTDSNATHAVSDKPSQVWFSSLLVRFRQLVKHLIAITALMNIIAMLVPLFIMTVYDKVIGTSSLNAVPMLVAGMVFALLVELGFRLLRSRTLGLVAGRLDYIVGLETFRQIVSLPPLLTERTSVAAQLSTLKQFESVRDFFTGSTAALFLEAPFVLLFIALIWILAGSMALVPIAMVVIYILFALCWLPGMNRQVVHAGAARTARQHMLMETFTGLKELKALGAEAVWRERFRETSSDTMMTMYRTATSQAVLESVTHSLMTLTAVAVLGMGTTRVIEGELSIGALIAVMALLWRVLGPIQSLFLAYVKFEQVFQGVKMINQLMKLKTEENTGKSGLLQPTIDGRITFDRLSFRYGPNSDPALLGVSFDVQPKEFIAVVGGNGGGKSTVLKLIAGMYTAQAGSVTIDGTDTRQFNPMDLRRLVAYVPQNPVLFHGSIAQNLRLKNVTATDADLVDAARSAGILDDIMALPEGFESRIGDNATDRLPGGLVHGLCLARAFVRAAPILLMDEPGASLDRSSDEALIQQLKLLKGTRTIVMVSHRPSHIKLADRAVVIDQGMVRFIGKPDVALGVMRGEIRP